MLQYEVRVADGLPCVTLDEKTILGRLCRNPSPDGMAQAISQMKGAEGNEYRETMELAFMTFDELKKRVREAQKKAKE